MKVLITGASGALGQSLNKVFKNSFCPTSKEMNVTDVQKVAFLTITKIFEDNEQHKADSARVF